MSCYRRPRLPGATVFFTVNLADRSSGLLLQEVASLRLAVMQTRAQRPFKVDPWVVLPDHMHCIWTLPAGDADYSTRMGAIKGRFSHAVGHGPRRASHITRREAGLWQRRFWEHHIRDDADYTALMEYCRINPVKHGLVDDPADWPYTSFR
ncbi:MAG: transposase [Loktanella sp.]|nr:transposase [Loktanella sp.]